MIVDLYGFTVGEKVELRCNPPARGCVVGLTSGGGRLLIEVQRKGRRFIAAVHPAHLRPVAC